MSGHSANKKQNRKISNRVRGVRKGKSVERLWDLLKPVDFCKQKPF